MPIYEYQCNECGHRMEAFQKINDPQLTTCPSCEKTTLKKLISASAFQLKGNGWYVTDFKDKKPEKSSKADNEKTGKSDSGKSETKSESKKTDASSKQDKKKSTATSD